jgi:hypothetical protein
VIDSQESVRLRNPLLVQTNSNAEIYPRRNDLHSQLAVVLLQAALLVAELEAMRLVEDGEKLMVSLIRKGYSYKLIGLIVVLLCEKSGSLPTNLKECMDSQYANPWLEALKQKVEDATFYFGEGAVPKNLEPEEPTAIRNRRQRLRVQREDEETEDSQNQTVVKYRNGKRVRISKIANIEEVGHMNEIGYKMGKKRMISSFNNWL